MLMGLPINLEVNVEELGSLIWSVENLKKTFQHLKLHLEVHSKVFVVCKEQQTSVVLHHLFPFWGLEFMGVETITSVLTNDKGESEVWFNICGEKKRSDLAPIHVSDNDGLHKPPPFRFFHPENLELVSMLEDPLKLEAQDWRNHFHFCVKGGNLECALQDEEFFAQEEGREIKDVEVLSIFFHGARVHNMEVKGFNITHYLGVDDSSTPIVYDQENPLKVAQPCPNLVALVQESFDKVNNPPPSVEQVQAQVPPPLQINLPNSTSNSEQVVEQAQE